jgi:hypothetical protein
MTLHILPVALFFKGTYIKIVFELCNDVTRTQHVISSSYLQGFHFQQNVKNYTC